MFWALIILWSLLCFSWTWKGYGWPFYDGMTVGSGVSLGPLAYFDTQSQTLVVIIATWFFGFFLIGGIVLISRRK